MIATSALAYWPPGRSPPSTTPSSKEPRLHHHGATLARRATPETQGNGVLFWRAITQWIGGFAAWPTVIAVLPFLGVGGPAPTKAKGTVGGKHLHSPHVRRILRQYLELYATLSAIGAGLYLLGGMGPFGTVTYAFTTISTGGFANHAGSFTYFGSPTLEWMGVAGMFLGGLSLALAWWRAPRTTPGGAALPGFAAYCGLIGGATLVIALVESPGDADGDAPPVGLHRHLGGVDHRALGRRLGRLGLGSPAADRGPGGRRRHVGVLGRRFFRWPGRWPLVTSCTVRVIIQLRPHAVQRVRVGDEVIEDRMVSRMLGYQVLFLITAAGGMVGLALSGADVVTATAGAVSSLATFGPRRASWGGPLDRRAQRRGAARRRNVDVCGQGGALPGAGAALAARRDQARPGGQAGAAAAGAT
ncbi:MAG: hypothetical protein R2704_04500 [Microthrixaceae bacterium]